jgi:energy-coupling factor transporter transmembrane protein EcfT
MISAIITYGVGISLFTFCSYLLLRQQVYPLLITSIFLSVFQASALLNIHIGQSGFGVQPTLFSLLFLMVAYIVNTDQCKSLKAECCYFWPLCAFVVLAILLNIIGPYLFHGMPVSNPRYGISVASEPLKFSSTNISYALYVIFYAGVFLTLVSYVKQLNFKGIKYLFRATVWTFLVVTALSIYQMLVIKMRPQYWPSFLINNKVDVAQLFNQNIGLYPRVSSTFLEPSSLSYYLSGMFLGCSLLWVYKKQRYSWRTLLLIWLVAFNMIVTLTSTAYICIIFECLIVLLFSAWKHGIKRALQWIGLVISIAILFWLVHFLMQQIYYPQSRHLSIQNTMMMQQNNSDQANIGQENNESLEQNSQKNSPNIMNQEFLQKMQSGSFAQRVYTDKLALKDTIDSWGIGVGGGSFRASSLITTLLVGNGVLGIILLILFLYKAWNLRRITPLAPGDNRSPYLLFFGGAWVGNLIAGCVAVPDITFAFFWINLAIWAGLLANQHLMRES